MAYPVKGVKHISDYDEFAKDYDQRVRRRSPVIELSYDWVLAQLRSLSGMRVCDLGCGQGELSRRISERGAHVTGVDFSRELLAVAQSYPGQAPIRWVWDDAQTCRKLESESYDVVVLNLMLMDLPDFVRVFESAYRILAPGGGVIWTVTHPCFQSPQSGTVRDEQGMPIRVVRNYAAQHWKSGGRGTIRSTLGAYHRPISDYLNGFIQTGFRLTAISEPTVPEDHPLRESESTHHEIPPILGVVGSRPS